MGHSHKSTKSSNQIPNRELGVCIFCEDVVYSNQDKFNLAIERPIRLDLFVHRQCYKEHRTDLQEFLNENLYSYLEKYLDEVEEHGKKKTPKRRKNNDKTNGKRYEQF